MSDKHYVGLNLTGFEDNGITRPVSRVTLFVDDENVITSGDDTGLELTADCPHATQAMANAILASVKGYKYQMYTADAAMIDPAMELGDGITAGGVYSVISRIDDNGSYPNISAPGEAELEDEFPTEGTITRSISQANRKIAETKAEIKKTADSIELKVSKISENVSDVSAELSLKVGKDENDQIVSMLNASADEINIKGNRLSITSTNFNVSKDGTITAKAGVIGESQSKGWNIGSQAIYNGTSGMGSNAKGTYIGTDGIRQYESSGKYVNIQGGVLTAQGVSVSGDITANSGKLGGWILTSTQLYNCADNEDIGANSSGNIGLSTRKFTRTVAGVERDNLQLAIGANFGVSSSGVLYAYGADITGKVKATSGDIGGWVIETSGISYTSEDNLRKIVLRPVQENTSAYVFYVQTRDSTSNSWSNPFRITGDGEVTATKVTITGKVQKGSTLEDVGGSVSGLSGTLSGMGGSVSGLWGSLSEMGGSFNGGHYNGTVGSCNLGNTSLGTGNGSASVGSNGLSGYLSCYGSTSAHLSSGSCSFNAAGALTSYGSYTHTGNFVVSGSKDRLIYTKNYGGRLLDAFETPMPTFSDYGTAKLDDNGICYITIGPIFAETVNPDYIPTVFLTKYGEGDIWVANVKHDIALVNGTPGLEFSWETRYQQTNIAQGRMRSYEVENTAASNTSYAQESDFWIEHHSIDYERQAYETLDINMAKANDYAKQGFNTYRQSIGGAA